MLTAEFAQVTGGESFDALSGLSHLLHVSEVRYDQPRGTPWDTKADHHSVLFQIVTRGECVIDVSESHRSVRLKAGDVAMLPHGSRYVVRLQLALANVPCEVETHLIGGRFTMEQPRENFVLAALPDVIVVRATEHDDAVRLHRLISAIGDELEGGRAGGRAIANDLASALVMMIVRIHVTREQLAQGLLSMLGHRRAARAVEAMLSSPARAWTLDELASQASASRASLVRMFQKTVRMAPLEFLAELRLGLARQRLSATDLPLAQIAAEIGYGSESSFSRAFQRRYGIRPAGLRTSGRAG